MDAELNLSVQLEVAPDVWLELEDPDNGLEISGESFASQDVTMRQGTAGEDSQVFAGTTVVRGVPDNIIEPVVVLVSGSTHYEFRTRLKAVQDGFSQLAFRMRVTVDDWMATWQCVQPASRRLDTEQAFILSTLGKLTVQVPHHPAVVEEQIEL